MFEKIKLKPFILGRMASDEPFQPAAPAGITPSDEEINSERLSTRRVSKLPASERVALGLELVEGPGFDFCFKNELVEWPGFDFCLKKGRGVWVRLHKKVFLI